MIYVNELAVIGNSHAIKNKLVYLNAVINDLKLDLKESIVIDDKFREEDNFEMVLGLQNDVYEDLTMKVIPTVSRRC